MELLTLKYKFLAMLLLGALIQSLAQTTFADNFSSQAYNLNDGTGNWSTNWIETNDDGSPNSGDAFIFLGLGNVLAFVGNGANGNGEHGINRTVNLSGATSATLSFDWRTQQLDTFNGGQEELGIFISNNNGATFTQIGAGTMVGNNIDSFSQDISPFISANTIFRLQVTGGGNNSFEDNEFAFIDNLLISAIFGPSVSVVNQTIDEDIGTTTITLQLSGGVVPGGFSVDYNTADNTAFADSDYTTSSGTLNFNGLLNETQTFTIPIINNSFGENIETFFVNLSNISNSTVTTMNGTITINDDVDTAIGTNVPLTLFDEFNGRFDYALTGGTFRDDDTNTCSIVPLSSSALITTVPAGVTIDKAYLLWAHSGNNADDVVVFEGQNVSADIVNQGTFGTQPYHGMVSDVTSIIQNTPNLSSNVFDVSGLSIDNTDNDFFYCGGNTTLGGWTLMVFYEDPSFPAVSINFYNGFDGEQDSTQSYTLSGFFAIGASGSKTSVLSWEGDTGTDNNEILSLTTTSGTNLLVGDGNNNGTTTNNPFNSTIYDNTVAPVLNNLNGRGIDLDTYDISPFIAQGESSATTNIRVGGDFILLNSVILKVPSNLITGTVFEDINYPGGIGRDFTTSNGVGIEGAIVELYDNTGTFIESDITNANGIYNIGGMENGTYSVRVVNSTIQSTRGGGDSCTTCIPVQTFRSEFASSTLSTVTNEIGGANPSATTDSAEQVLANAQTISEITIESEGAVGVDFGFNFNTIVNTNETGQGSLEQFIVNSNTLDETGLDIEANSLFDPPTNIDYSIFMIPTTDANFNGDYYDIFINNTALTPIMDNRTTIDGRTQRANFSNSNTGNIPTPSGGNNVGTLGSTILNYPLPEIQVHRDNGDVFRIQDTTTTIRDLAIYANNNAGILIEANGGARIIRNLLGVDATGTTSGNINYGVEITDGTALIFRNYIAQNTDAGIWVNGGTSTSIRENHITTNGKGSCNPNILINGGSNITIQQNLIESSEGIGIEDTVGNIIITENTITNSGTNTACTNNSGIQSSASDSQITNNIIHTNAGDGIALTGTTSGNLISQNSIYANGTITPALGIDLGNDGVTINDNGDVDSGANGLLNFPVFESVTVKGNILKVIGWSRPGAVIELFITDINEGTASAGDNQFSLSQDYGEGQIYIGTITEGSGLDTDTSSSLYPTDIDGNTDNTERFNISITLTNTIPTKTIITATATVSNTTSEFGSVYAVRSGTVITNRRITYRVKK